MELDGTFLSSFLSLRKPTDRKGVVVVLVCLRGEVKSREGVLLRLLGVCVHDVAGLVPHVVV